MHFTYCENPNRDNLTQGDILNRTPEIEKVLEEIHPHYFKNIENKYFIVLSQSCDLVRRSGKNCATPYITIAAVRSLSYVLEHKIESLGKLNIPTAIPIISERANSGLDMFLSRLFNNNETDLFYLNKEPAMKFPEDCCAFLRLFVPIKSDLHYSKCLEAKVLELEEGFRAKLGFKVGQIFSRVGTEDWPEKELKKLKKDKTKDRILKLPQHDFKNFNTGIKKWAEGNPDKVADIEVLQTLIKDLPKKRDQIIERLTAKISESSLLKGSDLSKEEQQKRAEKIVQAIMADPIFSSLIK